VQTETRRTSRIVSNRLAFSRQSKMEPKRLSLNRLIEQPLLLQVNFEDTARGIPEENIAKLFEPFFHHQEKRQGCRSGSIRGSFLQHIVRKVWFQPSRRPRNRPVKSKKKLLELDSKICRCWVSH